MPIASTTDAIAADARLVAARIRSERLKRGWDVGNLAEKAGISRTTLYHLERGTTTNPRGSTLNRIAEALDVPVEQLLPGSRDNSAAFSGLHHPAAGESSSGRVFDRQTNPVVAEVVNGSPELFLGWNDEEWDELYSTFGTGGPLNRRGIVHAANNMNRKRETTHQLHILLETHMGEVAARMIGTLYEMVRPGSNLAATAELAALLARHEREHGEYTGD